MARIAFAVLADAILCSLGTHGYVRKQARCPHKVRMKTAMEADLMREKDAKHVPYVTPYSTSRYTSGLRHVRFMPYL